MKYGLSISDQISHFLFAVGFGFIIGIFYRLVSAVRRVISSKKTAYIVQDVFFSVTATVLCFLFMLAYSNGDVRLDLIAAIAVGAGIYFLTMDSLIRSVVEPFAALIKKLLSLLFRPFIVLASIFKRLNLKRKSETAKVKARLKEKVKQIKSKPKQADDAEKAPESANQKKKYSAKKHNKLKKSKKNNKFTI
ncbi:MAG: hypothetical protein NC110_01570 [Ruminococcus sp.]|nr:hypothetical protein [Ruminococcus sp.]